MTNLIGIGVSLAFVLGVIGLSTLLEQKHLLSGEGTRKFIHIAVCNWWLIAMAYFTSPWWAAVVPLLFVFVNYISYKKQVFKAMERGGGLEDLGTVYYAISLLVLALWSFGIGKPYIGCLGIFIMGYGDGFAAVVGQAVISPRIGRRKSLAGSLTVLIFGTLITAVMLNLFTPAVPLYFALVMGLVAALLEAFTPMGFDNLSLPLVTSFLFYGLERLFG